MMRDAGDDLLDGHAGLDARPLRHPDVEQDDVGKQLSSSVDCSHRVAGLADHLDVVLLGQDHLQATTEEGMVVDDQHPDRVAASSWARGLPRGVRGHGRHDGTECPVRVTHSA